jgi:hypothetical protein
MAEERFDERTHAADVLARVDGDIAGARERYVAILADVRAVNVDVPGALSVALATAQRERAPVALVANIAALLASEKAAFAPCPNAACGCAHCTCGTACTRGVSMVMTCDPCVCLNRHHVLRTLLICDNSVYLEDLPCILIKCALSV